MKRKDYCCPYREAEQCLPGPYHFSGYILEGQRYSIAEFLKDHHDTEDELKDIRETIRLYQPPPPTNPSIASCLHSWNFRTGPARARRIEEEVLIRKR